MSELKPCPFCGAEAEMFGDGVICSKCFALMTENTARGESMGYEVSPVEIWNTRAERTCTNIKMDRSYFMCSRCHAAFDMLDWEGEPVIWVDDSPQFNSYCPHCGAKVVG